MGGDCGGPGLLFPLVVALGDLGGDDRGCARAWPAPGRFLSKEGDLGISDWVSSSAHQQGRFLTWDA